MATSGYNTTWQQVSGPSLSGLDQMSALIRGAVSSGVAAVDGWQKAQQENAAGQMIQESLKYTNPNDLEAAMARGDLTRGINPQYITPSLMKDVQARISDTRGNEIQKANVSLGQQRIDLAKTEQERLLESLNKTKINNQKMFEYQSLIDSGDKEALKKWTDAEISAGYLPKEFGAAAASMYKKGADFIDGKVSDNIAGAIIQGYAQNPAEALSTVGSALANKTPEEQLALKASLKKHGLDITDPKVLQGANAAETLLSNATNVPAPVSTGSFDPVKLGNAIYQQESSSGKADTSKVNSQNVTGPMQVQQATFEGLKKNGVIPQHYDWKNPEHNKAAGFAHIADLSKTYKTPEQVAAVYYGGPDAVNADGSINRNRRNPERPNDPTVGQYVDQVMSKSGMATTPASNATAQLAAAVQPAPVVSAPIVDIYSGLRVNKPFSDTIDVATQTGNEIRSQVDKGNYAGAVGAAIKGAIKGVPAVTNDIIGRPISILATGLGNQTNEVIKGATGFDLTGPQNRTTPDIEPSANSIVPEAAKSFTDEQAAANHDTSRGLQALRNAKVNTAVGAFDKAEVQRYVEAQHKRTVPGDEEKTLDNNLAFINKNLPGNAKIGLADLRKAYEESAGKDEATRPDISVWAEMLIKSRKTSGILGLGVGGKSLLSDKGVESVGDVAYMYDPDKLSNLIKGFEPATIEMRKEISKVVKEQAADTAKSDSDLKALRDQIIDLEKTVAANKRFGLPNGATEASLAIARAAEIEATAKAKSKLNTAINLSK